MPVRAQFARHRVAQPAFGIVILDRHDEVPGLLRGGLDHVLRPAA